MNEEVDEMVWELFVIMLYAGIAAGVIFLVVVAYKEVMPVFQQISAALQLIAQ